MTMNLEVRERRVDYRNIKHTWPLEDKGVVVGEEVRKVICAKLFRCEASAIVAHWDSIRFALQTTQFGCRAENGWTEEGGDSSLDLRGDNEEEKYPV